MQNITMYGIIDTRTNELYPTSDDVFPSELIAERRIDSLLKRHTDASRRKMLDILKIIKLQNQ